jgi:hypothetical protein
MDSDISTLHVRIADIISRLCENNLIEGSGKWKDFLLWFKREYFSHEKIMNVNNELRILLHINQTDDVKSGIEYTYYQWLLKYKSTNNSK